MTIRPYSSIASAPELPIEIPYMVCDYLNLQDMLKIELVCKTLFEISVENNSAWKRIADKKCIPVDSNAPIRAQVLSSFTHYCKATYAVFPHTKPEVSSQESPAYQRLWIDHLLIPHYASIKPYEELVKLLKNFKYEPVTLDEDTFQTKASKAIQRIQKMTPEALALVQLGIEVKGVFQTWIFRPLALSDFGLGSRTITTFFEKRHNSKTLLTPLSKENTDFSLEWLKILDEANEAALPLLHYIFKISKRSSLGLQFIYYKSCAYSELIKAIAPIRIVIMEQKQVLDNLLTDLSEEDWKVAFEGFMHQAGLSLDFKIQYPKEFHEVLMTLNEIDKKKFLDFMKLPMPDTNTNEDLYIVDFYIIQKINESLTQSINL